MMYYTHCQNCGRKLTSTASQIRGYGWECWKKLQDEAPGLFDDDVSKAQENQIKKQSGTRKTCPCRVRTRPTQMRKLWALGAGWSNVPSRAASFAGRAGYFRKRRFALRRLSQIKA